MTISPESNERDWDAEFAEITGHLDDVARTETTPRSHGANRDQFGSNELPGARETPVEHASTSSSDEPVPGFRAQWRIEDDARTAHAVGGSEEALGAGAWSEGQADAGSDAAAAAAAEADDFVPAPPQPLETNDPATVIMLGCLVGGPVWLLYLTLFDRDTAMLWWSLAALTLVVGFVLAVVRQPRTRDDEDDDGARL